LVSDSGWDQSLTVYATVGEYAVALPTTGRVEDGEKDGTAEWRMVERALRGDQA
jgi:hypothetical protein